MKKLGSMIVLSGPSGAGKSTLVSRLRERMPELQFSISCTTRPPRSGEKDGIHYYFLSREAFDERVKRGEFIEYADVFAHRYGTLKQEVLGRVRGGNSVILDIDVQGASQIRKTSESDPELKRCACFVLIGPPSLETLEQRLRGRASDSEEQIRLRLENARRELSFWKEYDYLIINNDLDSAVSEMTDLIRSFGLRTACITEELFS